MANSFKTSTFSVATSQLQLATTGDSLLDEDLTGVVVTYDRARFERDYTAPTTTTAISIDTGITPYTLTLEAGVQVVGKFDPEEQSGVPLDYTMTYSEPGCVTVGECSDSLSSVTNTCKGKTYCMDDECVQNGGSYNYATRTCITTRYLQVCT